MLLHINGKFKMGKFKSSLLSESFVNLLDGKKTKNFGRYQRGNEKHVNRTNNEKDKTKKAKRRTIFNKILHRRLKTEQHDFHRNGILFLPYY